MSHPYDPELAAALAMMAEVDLSDLPAARAAQAREVAAQLAAAAPDATGVEVTRDAAPGPAGAPDVPLQLYRPHGPSVPDGIRLPAVLSLHGGGFVLGFPDVDHEANLRLARDLGALVVAPDYRLAPEHPYPAALEDCYATLVHLAEHATGLRLRPEHIAVGGDSAGAGLAAALCLLTRDRGGPGLCFQYLCSPELDDRLTTPSALAYTDTPVWNRRNAELSWSAYLGDRDSDRESDGDRHRDRHRDGESDSDRDHHGDRESESDRHRGLESDRHRARDRGLESARDRDRARARDRDRARARDRDRARARDRDRARARDRDRARARDRDRARARDRDRARARDRDRARSRRPGTGAVPVYAAPGRAVPAELAGLPPALVAAMHFDPLRDEAVRYAQALLAAGVHAELHVYPGTFHGAIMVEHAAVVRRIRQDATAALRRAFGGAEPSCGC